MATPNTTFRFDPKTLKGMERLITNPPSILIDVKRGGPRSRNELVAVLVEHALRVQASEKKKDDNQG